MNVVQPAGLRRAGDTPVPLNDSRFRLTWATSFHAAPVNEASLGLFISNETPANLAILLPDVKLPDRSALRFTRCLRENR
jgi:hypothetical protein